MLKLVGMREGNVGIECSRWGEHLLGLLAIS